MQQRIQLALNAIAMGFSISGNPNIRAMNRQMATDENDQYQFSK
jgi:hypothetical protein